MRSTARLQLLHLKDFLVQERQYVRQLVGILDCFLLLLLYLRKKRDRRQKIFALRHLQQQLSRLHQNLRYVKHFLSRYLGEVSYRQD